MSHTIIDTSGSRSFPTDHALLEGAADDGDVVIIIGTEAGPRLSDAPDCKVAVVVELGTECLGVHTGEAGGDEGSNVLGFARFRLGESDPTDLVELVRQPNTSPESIDAARAVFENAGLVVAVCNDFAGRIVDRLIRPYYNEALRQLDQGLASAKDMDLTLKLGLGYPEGPIELLERTGLSHHFEVAQALFEAYGELAYAPARRSRVAMLRGE
jgi:3-hydroxybutyryl-CoA dehydrogenase